MRTDRGKLAGDLRDLGLRDGAVVIVHSSLSGLGWVDGGVDAVIDALLAAVGERGTVLFPTLTGTDRDGPEDPPVVDLMATPCWTGAIPEASRHRAGAVRSIHPTHSVTAIGALTKAFTAGHERSRTPCDEHSPYSRLMEEGGHILLLGGVTHESNTTLHALEELAGAPYHLQDEETDGVVILPGGERVTVRNRLHLWRWERDFLKVDALIQQAGMSRSGRVGESTSTLVSAAGLKQVVLPLLRDDPLFLLARQARDEYVNTLGRGR